MKTFNNNPTTLEIRIFDAINNANSLYLMELNNKYCEVFKYEGKEIYLNDEDFFNVFYPNAGDAYRLAQNIGEYDPAHGFIVFDGHGYLQSLFRITANDLCELPINMAINIADKFADFSELEIFKNIIIKQMTTQENLRL